MSSDERIDSASGQADGLDEGTGLIALADERFNLWLTELAGADYDQLMSSRTYAQQSIRSPDGRLRAASLVILARQWLPIAESVQMCLQYLTDLSELVVQCAVDTLSYLLPNTQHYAAGSQMAALASSDKYSWPIRVAAYRALVFIHDSQLLQTHNLFRLNSETDFDKQLLAIYQ